VPLLLCDFDDTLVDRTATFERWATAYLAELGAPANDVSWLLDLDQRGLTERHELFELLIARYELTDSIEGLTDRYHRDFIPSFRCEAEVISALKDARVAGYKVAVVTNGSARAQGGKIEATGIATHVDVLCIAEGVGHWKPAREIFEIAAERCGESLDDAWMIGDNPVADVGGARACGARTIWIRTGEWPAYLDYEPDYSVDSFSDAVRLVLASADEPSTSAPSSTSSDVSQIHSSTTTIEASAP
jgi:putative hydrolase of the HAD superfamily